MNDRVCKEQLIQNLRVYYNQYLYLKDVYTAFGDSILAEELSEKEHVFFEIATPAFIDSYLMTLARFFDNRNNVAGLKKLVSKCKGNLDLFNNPEELSKYLNKCEDILDVKPTLDSGNNEQDMVSKGLKECDIYLNGERSFNHDIYTKQEIKKALLVLRKRRNKCLAHNDEGYFYYSCSNISDGKNDNEYLPNYMMWNLINLIKELLEKLLNELSVDYSDMKCKYNGELKFLIPQIGSKQFFPLK